MRILKDKPRSKRISFFAETRYTAQELRQFREIFGKIKEISEKTFHNSRIQLRYSNDIYFNPSTGINFQLGSIEEDGSLKLNPNVTKDWFPVESRKSEEDFGKFCKKIGLN